MYVDVVRLLRVGTGYGAPEIVMMQEGCGTAADMWSVGVRCLSFKPSISPHHLNT